MLGTETVVIKAGDVWSDRLIELSARKKDAARFRELMSKADLRYFFDAIPEVHAFHLQFPASVEIEDLEFFRDFILKLEKAAKVPVIEFDGEPQKYTVVLTSETEDDVHKGIKRKAKVKG